jgi:hypothetical protein
MSRVSLFVGSSILAIALGGCADSATAPASPAVAVPSRLSSSGGSGSGGSGGSGGTISTPTVDSVKFGKHSYDAPSMELLVSASSSNTGATLSLYNSATGAYIGPVQNGGGGKYGGNVYVLVTDPGNITIKSSGGGQSSIDTVPFTLVNP